MKRQFTLIELLIVVAIIAILAAMLLPVLGRAKQRARIIVEVNDRRQLMMATTMYCQDHEGVLPDRSAGGTLAISYAHALRAGPDSPNLNVILLEEYVGPSPSLREEFFFCQSTLNDVRGPHNPYRADYHNDHTKYTANYGTLTYFNAKGMPGSWLTTPFDLTSLQSAPSDAPVWGCWTAILPSTGEWFGHNSPRIVIPPLGQSTVFVDGSAGWFRYSQLIPFYQKTYKYYMPER